MRTLSTNATASMMAEETDKVWLELLTIEHADLAEPIRVVNNIEDILSRGEAFVGLPFEIELPGENPDAPGEARLRIDNVDREIVRAIRSISGPPTVTIEVILADSPNTVELALNDMVLRDVTYDVGVVEGTLRHEDIVIEPVAEIITPQRFPDCSEMSEIPASLIPYIGLSYDKESNPRTLEEARVRGVYCWSLFALVQREVLEFDIQDYDGPLFKDRHSATDVAAAAESFAARFQRIDPGQERFGDGILLRMLGVPIHIGLVAAPGWMLHIEEACGSVMERYDRRPWSNGRIIAFYRGGGRP